MDEANGKLWEMKGLLPAVLLVATPVFAQVQVDARLEKTQYLEGEPIFVIVDVTNVGDDAVGYSGCDGSVALTVAGVPRGTPVDISDCFFGIGSAGGSSCSTDHRPLLHPGERTSFRYLLRDYDLKPGTFSVIASGKAGVLWQYYPGLEALFEPYQPGVPPPPALRHRLGEPVPGAMFERTFEVTIVAGTRQDLQRAFTGYVSDADGRDPARRIGARAAIVESAPPFLEPIIARIAAEDRFNDSAVDALGRIASPDSRSSLKRLFQESADPHRRSAVALALARVGHPDDAEFLAGVLRNGSTDTLTKGYAALGLGRIGGDQAVRYLDAARASVDDRTYIAAALGNTRSRLAVPVLISMFDGPDRDDVCGPLMTLTHRMWCDGSGDVGAPQTWQRWWRENGSSVEIHGTDACPDPQDPLPLVR